MNKTSWGSYLIFIIYAHVNTDICLKVGCVSFQGVYVCEGCLNLNADVYESICERIFRFVGS